MVQADGSVIISSVLDYETVPSYNLIVQAEDQGIPILTGTMTLTINLIDVNDNAPVFSGTQTSYNAQEVCDNS